MLEAVRGFGSGLFAHASREGATGANGIQSALSFMRPGGRERIEAFLDTGSVMALFYVEVENFQVFQDIYGGLAGDRVLAAVHDELETLTDELLDGCRLRCLERLEPGRFLLLCGSDDWDQEHLGDLVLSMRLKLKSRIKQEALNLAGQGLNVLAGYGSFRRVEMNLEDTIYSALSDARRVAAGILDVTKLSLLREFREIVSGGDLNIVYQPIVNLETGMIKSWEALTRGPAGSHFQSPAVLFDFAEEVDQVFTLEKCCRENAIRQLGTLGHEQRLFLNIHPRTLVDPDFNPGQTASLLEQVGITPREVVLEITERHSVRDFDLFHRTLEHYRSQGFKVAVDDVGTGYSGLWTIANLRPDYLKVDMSLVRGIHADPVKRALMETLVTFSDNIGCRLIAEGIEEEAELTTLMRMGVHFGQGYFLSRPDYPKPGLAPEVQGLFAPLTGKPLNGERGMVSPLMELVEQVPTVDTECTVAEVRDLLEGSGPMGAVVVMRNDRPKGLVMRHHLDHALSSRYGVSLYLNRPVSLIMDPSPLFAESSLPLEKVGREAMKRSKDKVFDHIVVTERGRLVGLASVQGIMGVIATAQVEMAKGANPLTGLPGNVVIELDLERRCNAGDPFSIIYADLDNFKVYNDTYGFKNGDKIIKLIATILQWAVRRHGDSSRDFIGHIGGDDFVAMCNPARAERISKAVTRCFGRLVRQCYTPADRDRGWIEAKGRDGTVRRFPLVSVSLAIVDCRGRCDLSALGHRAAEMKKYAKRIPGNSYVRDRRGVVGCDALEGGFTVPESKDREKAVEQVSASCGSGAQASSG